MKGILKLAGITYTYYIIQDYLQLLDGAAQQKNIKLVKNVTITLVLQFHIKQVTYANTRTMYWNLSGPTDLT